MSRAFSQPLDSEEAEPIEISARTLPEEAKGESDVIALLREADEAATPEPPRSCAERERGDRRRRGGCGRPVLWLGPRSAQPSAAPAPARSSPPAEREQAAPEPLRPPLRPRALHLQPLPSWRLPSPRPRRFPRPIPPIALLPMCRAAGPVAKLIARNRTVSPPEGVRIEDVVAALRAVRDRSAS